MLLIKNGYIKPIVGDDIEKGCVLIGDDGKIAKVAKSIKAPAGAKVIDAKGKLVTPGLVEGHCHLGMENRHEKINVDHNEKTDPITPQMRTIDSFNPFDPAIKLAVKGGVTTVCTGPGSANIVGGTFAAIKLMGKRVDNMVVKHPLAMKIAFGENPKNFYGQQSKKAPYTRMGIAALLREFLFKAEEYADSKKTGKDVPFNIKLEAMIPVMNGEIPLKAHAHRADDIFTAIRIAKEFNLKLTLDHCTEGHLIADELGKENYCALVGPNFGMASKSELLNKSFSTAYELYKEGVCVSIITDSPVIPQERLAFCAGLAAGEGLPLEEAWRAITINPAKATGIADRVGSLEEGKDGDVVIWDGNPLTDISAKAYMTIIEGNIMFEA
ncbi:MAG: amidohydrolase [Clostridia bacterium]|nr:amidohydrolase [Clostridia bacterium]